LLQNGDVGSNPSGSFAAQLASTLPPLIINITASLLQFVSTFDLQSLSQAPHSEERSGSSLRQHETFSNVALDLVQCVQGIFELSNEKIDLIANMCRNFVISGRYQAINRHFRDKKVSLIDALHDISDLSLKLKEFHQTVVSEHDASQPAWPSDCAPALTSICAIAKDVSSGPSTSHATEFSIVRALESIFRLLATQSLQVVDETLFKDNMDFWKTINAPFLDKFVEENRSLSTASVIRCEALLRSCLTEMHRLICTMDISTLANDFMVSGLIETLVLLLTSHPESNHDGCQIFLPLDVRRRSFYMLMAETQTSTSDPPAAFLRFIEVLKFSLHDCTTTGRKIFESMPSIPVMRVVLHDLSASDHSTDPSCQNSIHGCDCPVSNHDQFFSRLLPALEFRDSRLLPQLRMSTSSFGADRREQGFTQTLSFQDPADWMPLQTSSTVPVRMWLCRQKCPPFNIEGRRMFVKADGIIGCGQGSCGDDKKYDYVMCQACCAAYRMQPPDFSTAIEVFSDTSFNEAVLSLPHQPQTSSEPLVNRAGAPVRPGGGLVIYCGRNLGRDQIPRSNGVCGPSNGPQCADCAFSFPIDPRLSRAHFSTQPPSFPGARSWTDLPHGQAPVPSSSSYWHSGSAGVVDEPVPPLSSASSDSEDPAIISELVEQMGFNRNAAMRALAAGLIASIACFCCYIPTHVQFALLAMRCVWQLLLIGWKRLVFLFRPCPLC
jgi:VanZ family protein